MYRKNTMYVGSVQFIVSSIHWGSWNKFSVDRGTTGFLFSISFPSGSRGEGGSLKTVE